MKILKTLVSRLLSRKEKAPTVIDEALDRLPEHYRLPVWLHCAENMPLEEVAEVLSISEKMACGRMMRGLEILAKSFRRYGESAPFLDVRKALFPLTQAPAPVRLRKKIELLVRDHSCGPWD